MEPFKFFRRMLTSFFLYQSKLFNRKIWYGKSQKRLEICIIVLATAMGIYSHFSALTDEYVIIDDVRQHVYWMQQFVDPDLFKNDLLTEYAKTYQPLGFIFLYRVLAFIIHPLVVSKILPLVLLVLSSVYFFRLVRHLTHDGIGFFASLVFMSTPTYFERMAGGMPRAFGFSFLIIFLYYLVKKEHLKACIMMVLQCLFYPMVFLLEVITFGLTLLKIQNGKLSYSCLRSPVVFFMITLVFSFSILGSKYFLDDHPSIGTMVSKKEMVGHQEFYEGGRYAVLPTPPMGKKFMENFSLGTFIPGRLERTFKLPPYTFAILVLCFFIIQALRKKFYFPREILCLLFAGLLMYKVADFLLLKLFLPTRYVEYSVPIIALVSYAIVVSELINKFRNVAVKRLVQVLVIVLIVTHTKFKKDVGLINQNNVAGVCEYLKTLPKDVMIAADPQLANDIPMFSGRKVFFNQELSHPWMEPYWTILKARTFNFFNAYYSDKPLDIYRFCRENGIDYLVVNEKLFTHDYLKRRQFYFNPFNRYIVRLIKGKKSFALANILDEDKLYKDEYYFVIDKDVLKN